MSPKSSRRARGEGALYQRADGLWIASIDLGTGGDGKRRRRYISSTDYATAVRKLRDLRRRAADQGGDLPTASMTLERWLTHWITDICPRRVKPTTLTSYRSAVDQQLIPRIGHRRIDQLTPQHVRDLHRQLETEGLAASTILKTHRVLGKALTDAMREGHATRNAAALVDAPRRDKNATRGALTAGEARALLRHAAGRPYGSRWAFATLTGARQGECLALEWDRIHWPTSTIDVSWQLQRLRYRHGCGDTCGRTRPAWCPQRALDVPRGFEHRTIPGSSLVLTRPKSFAGQRIIPAPDALAAILRRQWEAAGRPATGFVWTDTRGLPVDPRRDHDAWKAILAECRLPAAPLHSARHTTATLLHEMGVDGHTVQAIMGHSDVTTTRGYQHVPVGLARAALDQLGAALVIEG